MFNNLIGPRAQCIELQSFKKKIKTVLILSVGHPHMEVTLPKKCLLEVVGEDTMFQEGIDQNLKLSTSEIFVKIIILLCATLTK